MNIIIYGLGIEHIQVRDSIKSEHTVIGYCDDTAKIEYFYNKEFINLEALNKYNYDCILITEKSIKKADEIIVKLTKEYHVPREKIVHFFSTYRQRVDKVMDRKNPEHYDGMILGISHGAKGLNPACLKGNVCNLSFSSQDLYYNLITLKHCMKHYYEKIKTLRYTIIDMYDYCYFNHDTSLHSGAMGYYSDGGYCDDVHHFHENKRFHGTLQEELEKCLESMTVMSKQEQILKEEILTEKGYMEAVQGYDFEFEEPKLVNTITPDSEMPINGLYNGITKKRNEKTIQENIEAFDQLLSILKEINPDMQIILVMIPRYFVVEQTSKLFMKDWEEEFTGIIHTYQKKYQYLYLNYKDCTDISSNGNFYYDWGHLNYTGSVAFTSMLNQYIRD